MSTRSPLVEKTTRKAAAVSFLRATASGNVREACAGHVSPHFRHHNAYFRGDARSLAAAMEENAARYPGKILEIQHALEDGDLVAVHSRAQLEKDGPELALVHLFRFDGDRIVELWDIGQPVPKDSPNENGMF